LQQLGEHCLCRNCPTWAAPRAGTSFGIVESVTAVRRRSMPRSRTVEVRTRRVAAGGDPERPSARLRCCWCVPSAAAEPQRSDGCARVPAKVEGAEGVGRPARWPISLHLPHFPGAARAVTAASSGTGERSDRKLELLSIAPTSRCSGPSTAEVCRCWSQLRPRAQQRRSGCFSLRFVAGTSDRRGDQAQMLAALSCADLDSFLAEVVSADILQLAEAAGLASSCGEAQALRAGARSLPQQSAAQPDRGWVLRHATRR